MKKVAEKKKTRTPEPATPVVEAPASETRATVPPKTAPSATDRATVEKERGRRMMAHIQAAQVERGKIALKDTAVLRDLYEQLVDIVTHFLFRDEGADDIPATDVTPVMGEAMIEFARLERKLAAARETTIDAHHDRGLLRAFVHEAGGEVRESLEELHFGAVWIAGEIVGDAPGVTRRLSAMEPRLVRGLEGLRQLEEYILDPSTTEAAQ